MESRRTATITCLTRIPTFYPGSGIASCSMIRDNTQAFNRRQLEVVAMLELAVAIKAGEMFVTGSLSYDRFWDRLPREAEDPAAIAAYAACQGWGEDADGF